MVDDWDQLHQGDAREQFDQPTRVPTTVGAPGAATTSVFRVDLESSPTLLGRRARLPGRRRPQRSMVRPYTRTGGRTRSDLALEALVSTSERARDRQVRSPSECRRICELCVETRSIAELAAYLVLPLGVIKVLVGDLAEAGLVLIHEPGLIYGDRSSREFMERVLNGLRAI